MLLLQISLFSNQWFEKQSQSSSNIYSYVCILKVPVLMSLQSGLVPAHTVLSLQQYGR